MTDKIRLLTVDEFDRFAALPENVERKLQLVDGEIVEEMPKFAHARIFSRLLLWLGKYFEQNPIGEAFGELRIALPTEQFDARVPDICVVIDHKEELGALEYDDPLPFTPDFIIEIQSEGQSDAYMLNTAAYYLENGCKLVWLIYPDRKLIEWRTANERGLLTTDHTLNAGAILPDFTLNVGDIFA